MMAKKLSTILIAGTSFFFGYSISCALSDLRRASDVLESVIINKDTSVVIRGDRNNDPPANDSMRGFASSPEKFSSSPRHQEYMENPHQKQVLLNQQHQKQQVSTSITTATTGEEVPVDTQETRVSVLHNDIDAGTTNSTTTDIQFQKETAVVISTHLVPSHPSLDLLLEVLDSVRRYLLGLPEKCPIFITVDGIQEKYAEGKEDKLFLSADQKNREKYDSYIRALHKHFKDDDNVKILIAGKNIGLAENLKRVVENLHPSTKYMYLMQHDLPFAKPINHTAIVKTANEHPEVNIIRFNFKKSMAKPNECPGVPEIHANGIELKKWIKWSDQNQFARVSHYANDIFPILSHHTFPEMKMIEMASRNCSYYGLYYYAKGFNGPWYKHTDATERYGAKLAERVKRGELDASALSAANLKEMRRAGVNTTELYQTIQDA